MRRLCGDPKPVRETLSKSFIDAAAGGHLELIKSYLEKSAVRCCDHNSFQEIVNSSDPDGRYPLVAALSNRRIEVVSALLRAGVRVTTGTTEDSSLLAASGDTALLRMLLERSCNAKNPRVLLLIASHGLLDECRAVVSLKANVRTRDSNGITAANLALRNGHTEVFDFLSQHERILESCNFLFVNRKRSCEAEALRLPLPLLKLICSFVMEVVVT